jgi:hypothetical protein
MKMIAEEVRRLMADVENVVKIDNTEYSFTIKEYTGRMSLRSHLEVCPSGLVFTARFNMVVNGKCILGGTIRDMEATAEWGEIFSNMEAAAESKKKVDDKMMLHKLGF